MHTHSSTGAVMSLPLGKVSWEGGGGGAGGLLCINFAMLSPFSPPHTYTHTSGTDALPVRDDGTTALPVRDGETTVSW